MTDKLQTTADGTAHHRVTKTVLMQSFLPEHGVEEYDGFKYSYFSSDLIHLEALFQEVKFIISP